LPDFFNTTWSFIMIKKTLAALAIGLSFTVAMAQEISFGIISTEATQNLKADWQPLLDDMEKQTGLKVKAFFAPDYAGIIEGMRFNKVQMAWLGNKSAMEAVDRSNAEVFAQMVNIDGTQGYYSHLIVHKDSPLNNLNDVFSNAKNLSFGNGDPNSTSGARFLCVCPEQSGPQNGFQNYAQCQPRVQCFGRRQQAGGRGHQQQRKPGQDQRAPTSQVQ
jgi:phosphate/phosphite/phosphonate ABC transporter binding protein